MVGFAPGPGRNVPSPVVDQAQRSYAPNAPAPAAAIASITDSAAGVGTKTTILSQTSVGSGSSGPGRAARSRRRARRTPPASATSAFVCATNSAHPPVISRCTSRPLGSVAGTPCTPVSRSGWWVTSRSAPWSSASSTVACTGSTAKMILSTSARRIAAHEAHRVPVRGPRRVVRVVECGDHVGEPGHRQQRRARRSADSPCSAARAVDRRTGPRPAHPAIAIGCELDQTAAVGERRSGRERVRQISRQPRQHERHDPTVGDHERGLAAMKIGDLGEHVLDPGQQLLPGVAAREARRRGRRGATRRRRRLKYDATSGSSATRPTAYSRSASRTCTFGHPILAATISAVCTARAIELVQIVATRRPRIVVGEVCGLPTPERRERAAVVGLSLGLVRRLAVPRHEHGRRALQIAHRSIMTDRDSKGCPYS